jgi:polyhydroxybutyrate depolymerase
MENHVDDVGFISTLIDYMAQHYGIDTRRVYATGHSNGAKMSYRLACELSNKIAAIAPNASQIMTQNCHPPRAVPILHFHGTEDKCAPYEGGQKCGQCFHDFFASIGLPLKQDSWPCEPVPQTLDKMAELYRCQAPYISLRQGSVECVTHPNCNNGAEVTLCTIKGSGHTWPGGKEDIKLCSTRPNGFICTRWRRIVGVPTHDINASEMIWQFFSKYQLP